MKLQLRQDWHSCEAAYLDLMEAGEMPRIVPTAGKKHILYRQQLSLNTFFEI